MLIDLFRTRRRKGSRVRESGLSSGSILAVGGAEDKVSKRGILERFVKEAGGTHARIAILPTASTIPVERAAFYGQVFAHLGAGEAYPVPILTRRDAQAAAHTESIGSATGVFITGGDQSRLVNVLSETRAFEAIRDRLLGGAVVAGTSAGASAFSATMIVGGQTGLQLRKNAVKLAPGLGVITRLIIDQHFSQRQRLGRLLTAVALEPERLGVGIDEDTAIVYYGNGQIEVIGKGQVFILDGSKAVTRGLEKHPATRPFTLSDVVLHVLTAGDTFDVLARRITDAVAERAALEEESV
jgi:cyanophycinase